VIALRPPKIDDRLYVVVPFSVASATQPSLIDGSFAATLAYDALLRWPDLHRVDPLRVHDLVARRRARPASLAEAIEVARSANAGKLLWGELHQRGTRTVIRGVLYDVRHPDAQPREATVGMPSLDDSLAARFAALVDTLVANGLPRPPVGGSHPFAAVSEYTAGTAALYGWDLRAAQPHFRAALDHEPNYPAAALKLAEVSQWLETPPDQWSASARLAADAAELPR